MNPRDALDQVRLVGDEMVLFAKRPWNLDTDAEFGVLDAGFRVPEAMTSLGFDYFLEVSTAMEVLEPFKQRIPSLEECRSLLLYYGEHDAYPEWLYRS